MKRNKKTVWPVGGFDTEDMTCSSGIHFFFDRHDAAGYTP